MGAPKKKWSADEEEALREGVKHHGTGRWKYIKNDPRYKQILDKRSNVDLKDKWRNIQVAEGVIEKPSARKNRKRKQQQQGGGGEDGGQEFDSAAAGRSTQMNQLKSVGGGGNNEAVSNEAKGIFSEAGVDVNGTNVGSSSQHAAAQHNLNTNDPSNKRGRGGKFNASLKQVGTSSDKLTIKSLNNEEIVFAAIIALKNDKVDNATSQAIHQWIEKRYESSSGSSHDGTSAQVTSDDGAAGGAAAASKQEVHSLKEIERKLKKMCQNNQLVKDEKKGTYKLTLTEAKTREHTTLPPKKAKVSQMSKKNYKDLSTAEAAIAAARAVAEALAAAQSAEIAMNEAVAMEQLVDQKKREAEDRNNKNKGGGAPSVGEDDKRKPPKKR